MRGKTGFDIAYELEEVNSPIITQQVSNPRLMPSAPPGPDLPDPFPPDQPAAPGRPDPPPGPRPFPPGPVPEPPLPTPPDPLPVPEIKWAHGAKRAKLQAVP
jgi:hypothetical protein